MLLVWISQKERLLAILSLILLAGLSGCLYHATPVIPQEGLKMKTIYQRIHQTPPTVQQYPKTVSMIVFAHDVMLRKEKFTIPSYTLQFPLLVSIF